MAQGSKKLSRAGKPASGGRAAGKRMNKLGKGKVIRKPKRIDVATKLNASRRVTAAITRNIEKVMGLQVQKNGGALSLLKGVAAASRADTEKPAGKDAVFEDKTGEVKAADKAPRFNPKKRYKA
jgi:Protein of unknown function (DUF2462)